MLVFVETDIFAQGFVSGVDEGVLFYDKSQELFHSCFSVFWEYYDALFNDNAWKLSMVLKFVKIPLLAGLFDFFFFFLFLFSIDCW